MEGQSMQGMNGLREEDIDQACMLGQENGLNKVSESEVLLGFKTLCSTEILSGVRRIHQDTNQDKQGWTMCSLI